MKQVAFLKIAGDGPCLTRWIHGSSFPEAISHGQLEHYETSAGLKTADVHRFNVHPQHRTSPYDASQVADDVFHIDGTLRIGLGSRSILGIRNREHTINSGWFAPYPARMASPLYHLPTPSRPFVYQLAICSPTHVSHSYYGFLVLQPVLQLPSHPYQCFGRIQEAHKERPTSTSPRHRASIL